MKILLSVKDELFNFDTLHTQFKFSALFLAHNILHAFCKVHAFHHRHHRKFNKITDKVLLSTDNEIMHVSVVFLVLM